MAAVQPQCAVTVDRVRFPELAHVYWPREDRDLVTGAHLVRAAGTSTVAVGPGGLAYDQSVSVGTVSRPTVIPPAAGWTIELMAEMTAYGIREAARHDQSASASGTQDRSLRVNSSSRWEAYVFDGAGKTANQGTLPDLNQVYHVAATCTASALTVYLDGVPGTPTVVSNSGFTGYSSIHFLLGIGGNLRIYMAAVWHRPLAADEVAQRANAPYGILIPV